MASDIRLVSNAKGGNVCGTLEEGEIVIKEEMEDEATFLDLLMKPNDHQDDGAPYLAGNRVQLTIKEEEADEEEMITSSKQPSTSSFTAKSSNLKSDSIKQLPNLLTQSTNKNSNKPKHPYLCTVGRQTFLCANQLAQHERIHHQANEAETGTGEPPLDQVLMEEEVETSPSTSNQPSTSKRTGKPGRFQCSICQASFRDSSTTLEHIRGHSYGRTYKPTYRRKPHRCTYCHQAFFTRAQLLIHRDTQGHRWDLQPMRPKKPLGPEPRTEPPDQHPSHLARHQESHQTDDFLVMNASSTELETQEPEKERENQVEVSINEDDEVIFLESSTSKLNFNSKPLQSSLSTSKKGRYQCSICSASFSDSATTLEHIRGHFSTSRRATCPDCKQIFYSKTRLRCHRWLVHNVASEDDPPKGTVMSPPIVASPKPEKPPLQVKPLSTEFICQLCSKMFFSKDRLTVHLRQHTGERPYLCCRCPATFTRRSNLRRHEKAVHLSHSKGTSLLASPGLKNVENSTIMETDQTEAEGFQSGPSILTCPHCPRTYVKQTNLYRHVITKHTGRTTVSGRASKRAIACPQCTRVFYAKYKLVIHLKKHHEGNSPWDCDQCGALYGGKMELGRHRRQVHGEGTLHQAKRRQMEMEEIAVFQDHPQVKEEDDEDDDEEVIVFCRTIR